MTSIPIRFQQIPSNQYWINERYCVTTDQESKQSSDETVHNFGKWVRCTLIGDRLTWRRKSWIKRHNSFGWHISADKSIDAASAIPYRPPTTTRRDILRLHSRRTTETCASVSIRLVHQRSRLPIDNVTSRPIEIDKPYRLASTSSIRCSLSVEHHSTAMLLLLLLLQSFGGITDAAEHLLNCPLDVDASKESIRYAFQWPPICRSRWKWSKYRRSTVRTKVQGSRWHEA